MAEEDLFYLLSMALTGEPVLNRSLAGGLLALIVGTIQNRQRTNTSHTSVVERRNIEEGNVQHDVHEVRDDRRDV